MDANDMIALGLGNSPPWKLVGQQLDTDKRPKELHIELAAERGALFPCPDCARPCKAHDFAEFAWRHLNFFQHHCTITAKVPRTACPTMGSSASRRRGRARAAGSRSCSSKRP